MPNPPQHPMRRAAAALCLVLALLLAGLPMGLPVAAADRPAADAADAGATDAGADVNPDSAPLAALVTAPGAADAVTVDGNRFLRGGVPWIAEGVTLVGMVAPDSEITERAAYSAARKRFGPDMLQAVRDYGADTVRYQVSQGGLDPQSPIYDPAYRDQVLGAIALTRKMGFNVIVSMQWQGPSGTRDSDGMPDDTTRRAWAAIIGHIGGDRGILLELFNEPHLRDRTPENWAIWQADTQSLIDLVRAAGSQNVLLAGGLRSAHFLGGAPALHDPAGQLGYAVHPFLTAINTSRKSWDENFGDFSRDHPVMATAFNAATYNRPCRETFPQETDRLLGYLRRHQIGLVIWAFDLPAVRRQNGDLSNYDDFSCEKGAGTGGGAGEAVHEYFLAH